MGRQRTGMVETLRAVFAAGLLACGAALGAATAEEERPGGHVAGDAEAIRDIA